VTGRREMSGVLGLAGLAAALVLLLSGRPWLLMTIGRPAPFGPLRVHVSGRAEFPALPGLAVVALLAAVIAAVTSGRARSALGVLLTLAGAACGWYAAQGLTVPSPRRLVELRPDRAGTEQAATTAQLTRGWPALSLVLATVLLLCGVAVVARGRRWSHGLGQRYTPPAQAVQSDDPWRTLDRGDDPTIVDR
jgi:hypothetical protein